MTDAAHSQHSKNPPPERTSDSSNQHEPGANIAVVVAGSSYSPAISDRSMSSMTRTIRLAFVVRLRFFGIFWPLFWPAPSG